MKKFLSVLIITVMFIIGSFEISKADCGLPYDLKYGMSKLEVENKLKNFPTRRKNGNIQWGTKPQIIKKYIIKGTYFTFIFKDNKLTMIERDYYYTCLKKLYLIDKNNTLTELATNKMKTLSLKNLNVWKFIRGKKDVKIDESSKWGWVVTFINKSCNYSGRLIAMKDPKIHEDERKQKWILLEINEKFMLVLK